MQSTSFIQKNLTESNEIASSHDQIEKINKRLDQQDKVLEKIVERLEIINAMSHQINNELIHQRRILEHIDDNVEKANTIVKENVKVTHRIERNSSTCCIL